MDPMTEAITYFMAALITKHQTLTKAEALALLHNIIKALADAIMSGEDIATVSYDSNGEPDETHVLEIVYMVEHLANNR